MGFWAKVKCFKRKLRQTDANPANSNPTLSQFLTLPFRHSFPRLPRHKRELSPNKTPHRVSHAKMQCLQSPPLWWDLCSVWQWQSYQSLCNAFLLTWLARCCLTYLCWVDMMVRCFDPWFIPERFCDVVHSRTVVEVVWWGPFPNRCCDLVHSRTCCCDVVHSRTALWCGPFPNRCCDVVHSWTVADIG